MTVPVALHLIPLAGFAGLMATSAIEDFRRLIIPNGLILGLCVLWPFHVATAPMITLGAAGFAALCAAAVFLVSALLFSCGLIGGGMSSCLPPRPYGPVLPRPCRCLSGPPSLGGCCASFS